MDDEDAYEFWLEAEGLEDNPVSRLRYAEWRQAQAEEAAVDRWQAAQEAKAVEMDERGEW